MPRRTPILRRPITRWTLTILCITIFAAWCISFISSDEYLSTYIQHRSKATTTLLICVTRHGTILLVREQDPIEDSQRDVDGSWNTSFALTIERPPLSNNEKREKQLWWPRAVHRIRSDPGRRHMSLLDPASAVIVNPARTTTALTLPLWIPFTLFSLLTWRSWKLHLTHRAALRTNHCPHCNYSRTGLTPSSPCPECGTTAANPSTM